MAVSLKDKLMPTVAKIEREMIRLALKDHHGRVDEAARALGISRKGLYLNALPAKAGRLRARLKSRARRPRRPLAS